MADTIPLSPIDYRPAPTSSRGEDATGGVLPSSAPRPPNEAVRTPRSILRPSQPPQSRFTYDSSMHYQYTPRTPHSTASRTDPNYHPPRSITPDLRPRTDSTWAPRPPSSRGHLHDPTSTSTSTFTPRSSGYTSSPASPSHVLPPQLKRNSMPPHIHNLGMAGRFPPLHDVRMPRTPPADLERDRLARACGQSPAIVPCPRQERPWREDDCGTPIPASGSQGQSQSSSRIRGSVPAQPSTPNCSEAPSTPLVPKIKPSQMYRRLDALARRYNHRAMDYLSFEDVVEMYKKDVQLRGQLREKENGRVFERDSGFHVMGASLEDIILHASTTVKIGEYRHYLPIIVVACVEELTKTGIYQPGLFRALPSRDRHLQLIDVFDKSPSLGADFSLRGQTMPDICAVLSTFISSLPGALLDAHVYSAFWQWCVKPSVQREDAKREREDREEEERVARGEVPSSSRVHSYPRRAHNRDRDGLCLRLDTEDAAAETDQIITAQVLLRLLPTHRLSLLAYLCGFFTQLPLCPENGIQLEDVARIFGHRLLGGTVRVVAQRMMVWLLTRWGSVSEGLFGKECGMDKVGSPGGGGGDGCSKEDAKGGECAVVGERRSSGSSSGSPAHRALSSSSEGEDDEDGGGRRRRRKKRGVVGERESERPEGKRRSSRNEKGRPGVGKYAGHGSSQRRQATGRKRSLSYATQDPFSRAFADATAELDTRLAASSPGALSPTSSPPSSPSTSSPLLSSSSSAERLLYKEAHRRISRLEAEVGRRRERGRGDAMLTPRQKMEEDAKVLLERVAILEGLLRDEGNGVDMERERERQETRRRVREMRALLEVRGGIV